MLLTTILAFVLLLWTAFLASRNLLFPPALFAAVWLLSLVGLLIWGDAFYRIPDKAYFIYIVGGVAFTLGGILTIRLKPSASEGGHNPEPWMGSRLTLWALDGILLVLLIGLPVYWRQVSGSVFTEDSSTLLHGIRVDQVQIAEETSSFGVVPNLGVVAQFAAMAMVFELNGNTERRLRAILAGAVAFVYGGMAGTKLYALALVGTLVFVASLRARRLKMSTIAVTAGTALALFSLGLFVVNFAYETFGSSLEILQLLSQWIRSYWLSALVAFGFIALNPNAIASTQQIDRFFWETAASLGAPVTVPPKFAEYTDVSTNEVTNIYTVYFSYFKDYGWLGTVVIMFGLGVILTLLYRRAMRGRPVATILYAWLAFGVIVLSIVSEGFFIGLNSLIKLICFLLVLYWLLPALEVRRKAAVALGPTIALS